jgi:hypothetical protein
MSLGCGAYAGNITSDNITPLHLINIKRLAYEKARGAPPPSPPEGDLRAKVAAFVEGKVGRAPTPAAAAGPGPTASSEPPLDFVCEDDVRRALREGRVLRVSSKAVITPSARDAAGGTSVLAIVEDRP